MEASSPAARCKSCGGPSVDGDLCTSCKQAFAPVTGHTTVAEPSRDSAMAVTQRAPVMIRTTAAGAPPVVTVPPPAVTVPPPVVNVEPIQMEVARSETAKAVADLTAKAHLAKAANPAPVTKRPIVAPPPPQRPSRTRALMKAAALIVVAIGAAEGARRFGFHWPQRAVEEVPIEAPPPVVESGAKAERGAAPPDARPVAPVVAENRAAAIAPSKTPPSKAAASKPTTAAARRRAVRQDNSSDHRVVPAVAPAPAPETPAPEPTRPPAAAAAKAPAPPTGRFFERSDVDEPPQIATRVEPQLPANLPARPNAVVVVRVLVSQTGHPFRVSLLRGSMLGRSADEAVVAAVTRWTFSPAKKRGEPVNCWYNIGVPLGQAN